MRAAVLLAFALAACAPSQPSDNGASSMPIPEASAPEPALIPQPFLGSYDVDAAACAAVPGEMRLNVDPAVLRFHEGRATVRQVTSGPNDVLSVEATLNSGGMTQQRSYGLAHGAGGTLIVTVDGQSSTRIRCPDAPASARPLLAVQGEGIALVDANSGATRQIPFGMAREQLLQIVTLARGPLTDQGSNDDCGAGPQDYVNFSGIGLVFQQGKFAGWAVRKGTPPVTTMSGLGLGATRASLDSAYNADVSETSLGEEFMAGGISGVLSGAGPDAKVTSMWSGVNCIAR